MKEKYESKDNLPNFLQRLVSEEKIEDLIESLDTMIQNNPNVNLTILPGIEYYQGALCKMGLSKYQIEYIIGLLKERLKKGDKKAGEKENIELERIQEVARNFYNINKELSSTLKETS